VAQRTGFLGPPGTFGEQAALTHDAQAGLIPLPSHSAIVRGVLEETLDEGVVAVENSLEGAVSETLDALIQADGVFIKRELVLAVEHNLIAAPGTRIEDVGIVMSHPQALAQCRGFIDRQLPGVRLEAALSTAAAVASAVQIEGAAGIGTRRAAELAGGVILAPGIQDVASNKTRFLVLAKEDALPTGDDKTSIAFTVPHDRPGSLLGVLEELANRGINMTHIESRPSREDLGIYVFLIDFQGHRQDAVIASAMASVKEKADYFRLFGSYPREQQATGNRQQG
jgi:prephenate dehydratase